MTTENGVAACTRFTVNMALGRGKTPVDLLSNHHDRAPALLTEHEPVEMRSSRSVSRAQSDALDLPRF